MSGVNKPSQRGIWVAVRTNDKRVEDWFFKVTLSERGKIVSCHPGFKFDTHARKGTHTDIAMDKFMAAYWQGETIAMPYAFITNWS